MKNNIFNFTRGMPRRLIWLLVALFLGNLLSWLLALHLSGFQSSLLGLAALAWGFGARHAFDIDHIAAIDNVTRKLTRQNRQPVAIGFCFALGHSTVVIALSAVIAWGGRGLKGHFQSLVDFGSLFGTGISAIFLTVIGLINLVVLWQLVLTYLNHRRGQASATQCDDAINAVLARRGLLAVLLRFVFRRINHSWQMYPLGILFGLGFDTATEIAILGISASLATSTDFPLWGIMVFPALFTAGMTLMDSLDGLIMLRTYHWALSDSVRRLYFNVTITALSVAVALVIGTLEWLRILAPHWGKKSAFQAWLNSLDFSVLGLIVLACMLGTWLLALGYQRLRGTAGSAPLAGENK